MTSAVFLQVEQIVQIAKIVCAIALSYRPYFSSFSFALRVIFFSFGCGWLAWLDFMKRTKNISEQDACRCREVILMISQCVRTVYTHERQMLFIRE